MLCTLSSQRGRHARGDGGWRFASLCSSPLLLSLLLLAHSAAAACPASFTTYAAEPTFCYMYLPGTITWARALSECKSFHTEATLAQFTSDTSLATVAGDMAIPDGTFWVDALLEAGSKLARRVLLPTGCTQCRDFTMDASPAVKPLFCVCSYNGQGFSRKHKSRSSCFSISPSVCCSVVIWCRFSCGSR